jgi:transposase
MCDPWVSGEWQPEADMLYQRGKPYSQDLRERVFAASDDGDRVSKVAELLRVSVSYVSKALTRRRTTGETTARVERRPKAAKLAAFYPAIRERMAEQGDTTLEELRAWLLSTHRVSASVGLIWHTLRLLGLTLKKKVRSNPQKRRKIHEPSHKRDIQLDSYLN